MDKIQHLLNQETVLRQKKDRLIKQLRRFNISRAQKKYINDQLDPIYAKLKVIDDWRANNANNQPLVIT